MIALQRGTIEENSRLGSLAAACLASRFASGHFELANAKMRALDLVRIID